jgi:hypothetical protein
MSVAKFINWKGARSGTLDITELTAENLLIVGFKVLALTALVTLIERIILGTTFREF